MGAEDHPFIDWRSGARPELDRLTVVGGEPLLYPGIEEVLRAASATEIAEKRLTTNLTELKDSQIEAMKAAGFRACVSLDGATASQHDAIRKKGNFDKTIANLRRLIANGVDLEVTHSVTAQNAGGFRQLIELLRSLGVRRLNLHKVSPQGNAKMNRHMVMSATEWREFLRDTVFTTPKSAQPLTLRYPLLFATQNEYEQWSEAEGYHHHALGSFYSTLGHRLVLYADGKVFVSSEAFGTESYIGAIVGGRFEPNRSERNEVALSASPLFRVSDVNNEIQGDENYPVPLSFSYRRTIQL